MTLTLDNLIDIETLTVASAKIEINGPEKVNRDKIKLILSSPISDYVKDKLNNLKYTDCHIVLKYEGGESSLYIDQLDFAYSENGYKMNLVGVNIRWA